MSTSHPLGTELGGRMCPHHPLLRRKSDRVDTMTTEAKTVAMIDNSFRKMSKADDVRQDTALMMKPYSNWEAFLMPAPMSVAILGELIFISANDDFPIDQNMPKGGYNHIRYPQSFRACLVQISNQGWEAFNEAHKNMDQIRLHSLTIPNHIKNAVKILMQANKGTSGTLLPKVLSSVSSSAGTCLGLATAVENKFNSVMLLINELLEACTNSKGAHEQSLEEVKMKMEEYKLKEESAKLMKEMSEKQEELMKKQMEQCQDSYKSAMDSMPSGWEVLGMNFVDGLLNGLNNLVSAVSSRVACKTNTSQETPKQPSASLQSLIVVSKGNQIFNLVTLLEKFVTEDQKINTKLVIDQKTRNLNTNWGKNQLVKLKTELEQEEKSLPKQKAMAVINEAILVYSEFDYLKNNPDDENVVSEIVSNINLVCDKAREFSSYCNKLSNSSGLNITPPQMANAASEETTGQGGAGTAAVKNARFKIQQTSSMLKNSQDMYEKSFANLTKSNKELAEILAGIRNCKLKEIDFDKTIEILMKGLDALGQVKEQWGKMIRFFQMLCNLINLCLQSVNNFVCYTEEASKLPLYSMESLMKDMIYTEAFQATNIINVVHMISNSYVEISTNFLMDRLSGLGRIIALDPTRNGKQFDFEREKLHSDCDKASKGIEELILQNKAEFDKNLKSRVKKINENMEAMLPIASAEEKRMIEYTVNQGMDAATNDLADDIDI